MLTINIFSEDHVICSTAMQIFSHILKHTKKESSIESGLNTTYIIELFEKNIQNDPIVSVLALNLLAELLYVDNSSALIVIQKSESSSFFKNINELITTNKVNKMEEMRKIEGSGYGCPFIAFLDGVFIFLQKLSVRLQKENKKVKEFLHNMESSGINKSILSMML